MPPIEPKPVDPFAQAYESWKTQRTPETTASLLGAVQPDIDKAVRAFGGTNANSRSKAKILTIRALETYDPKQGKFKNHLFNHLTQLRRYEGQQNQPVKIPEKVALDRAFMDRATQELRDTLGREPNDADVSRHTGLSSRRLTHIRKFQPAVVEGQFSRVTEEGGLGGDIGVSDSGGRNLWASIVYDELGDDDKTIMEHTLGMHGKPVLENQALAKLLQRSPGLVSQRKKVIQEKLDQEADLSPFRT